MKREIPTEGPEVDTACLRVRAEALLEILAKLAGDIAHQAAQIRAGGNRVGSVTVTSLDYYLPYLRGLDGILREQNAAGRESDRQTIKRVLGDLDRRRENLTNDAAALREEAEQMASAEPVA